MSYNGSGTFNLYTPGNPVVTGTTISSTWGNNTLSDIATGLSTAITKDGQTTVTADIPMAGYSLTGLGAGTASGESLRYQQLFTTASIVNGYLDWSVSGNVLTVAIKTLAGADPSSTDPVHIIFRNVTAATGSPSIVSATAATSIAINNTATLGTTNSVAFRIWAVLFNDGGTLRMGVINCLSGTDIYPLAGFGIASSTQEADGADSAHVFYTDGAAVTSKAYVTVGYGSWETGLATAGTWSAAPTRAQLFGAGVPLPGSTVQSVRSASGAAASGSTAMVADDTIPQNTEGDEYMLKIITPTSAANLLRINHLGFYATSAAAAQMYCALFRDSTADALTGSCTAHDAATANAVCAMSVNHAVIAGSTSATTLKIRAGAAVAGTTTFNGSAGARLFGGVANSVLEISEISA